MTLRVGHPSKKGATDTSDARLDFRNRYVCNADGSPRGGVTSPIGVALLSATATMNVSVGAFSAVTVRDGGVVEMANDGPVNVLLDAPPSSQSRIDVVYVKQNDSSSTVSVPDANDLPVFGVLKGVASATPVKRTDLPAGAEEIGTVLIPSTATATNSSGVVITTTCRFTAAAGGKVPFRTLADLQAWTTAAPRQPASVLADSTTSNVGDYVWSGSKWNSTNSAFTVGAFTPTGIYSAGTPTPQAVAVNGRVYLEGLILSSSASFASGTTYSLGSIPAAFAPPAKRIFAVSVNTVVVGALIVNTNGTLQWIPNSSFTNALSMSIDGPSWSLQ
jgi:hypothetical protein